MLIRLVTAFNWFVIVLLALLVIVLLLNPQRGGDAATKGLGEGILWLAIIAMVILLALNLIPYSFARYVGLVLVVLPILVFWGTPRYRDFQKKAQMKKESEAPIFEDKNLDALARAVKNADVAKFGALLDKSPAGTEKNGELINFLLLEANSSYEPLEKQKCLEMLFDRGARLDMMGPGYETMHFEPAYSGNVPLLRLLLQKGLDANAIEPNMQRPILLEAIEAHQEQEATVRLLLESGAKPNVVFIRDTENGLISPLLHAAKWNRWGVCAALLEYGADPNFKSDKGVSFRQLFQEADKNFEGDGFTTRADFERAKQVLGGR